MGQAARDRLHASCVALEGRGVLLVGPSGVGKSDVALRLIEGGAELVSDDQTEIRVAGASVVASPPEVLAGLIEVRGVGLMRLGSWCEAQVALYVELVSVDMPIDRLPEAAQVTLCGQQIKKLILPGFAASTPAKIRAALTGVFEDV